MAYFRKVTTKNKKGYTWSFTLDIGRDPATGKRKQITRRGFEIKKEAELAAHQIELEIENETYVEEKTVLFKDFILVYLQLIAKPSVRPSTFNGYEKVVGKRLIPKFGHLKIKNFSPIMISKYYKELLDEGLTEEYVQYIHSILKMAALKQLLTGNTLKTILWIM